MVEFTLTSRFKKTTLFEKLLLVVGIFIGVMGFWLINSTYQNNPIIDWPFVSAIFLWLLLIFIVILTDSSENIKEELRSIIKEHIIETKLLREEVILLRKIADKFVKKK